MDDQSIEAPAEALSGLTLDDKVQEQTREATEAVAGDKSNAAPAASTSFEAAEPAAGVIKQQQVQPTTHILDPAIKQALIDTNRDTVLKLEETVLEFMADSSKSSLEFPPSTSNFERLLQHKVAQHHLLQTSTLMVAGTPRVSAKRPDKPLAADPATNEAGAAAADSSSNKKGGSSSSKASKQAQAPPRLSTIEVASIKVEPKALMRRPPSANSMRGPDGTNSSGQQQQQRKKTHKEREADYHEARERLLGNSLAHSKHSGSTGNLTAAAAAAGGSRPGSANAAVNRPSVTAGASYLAAVPPTAGERGFTHIVNPGRGGGRGGVTAAVRGRGGGRGAGGGGIGADVTPAVGVDGGVGPQQQQQQGGLKQQQGGHKQQPPRQQQQQQQPGGGGRGPKAVYRDRQRDVQDPDYARGVDRFQPRFDPGFGGGGPQGNMYNIPTYGSEFPSLAGPANSAAGKHQQQQQQRSGSANRQSPGGHGNSSGANGNGSNGPTANGGGVGGSSSSSSSRAEQRHQQYQAAQQQQQQMAAAAGAAQWGYGGMGGHYSPLGDPAAAAAAAAMQYQMAAMGGWGYGMGGPMDPNMAAAAAAAGYQQYPAGYGDMYGGSWGWGGMQGGGGGPYAAAGGYGGGQGAGYGMGMGPEAGAYGGHRQQQQQHERGNGRGAGKGGSSSKPPTGATAASSEKQ